MFKKIISVLAAVSLAFSAASAVAAAKSSFSDVISPDYDWAVDDIEEMTTLGIIKGYNDGTFRPASTIRKIEALLLLARAAGYSNPDYDHFAARAVTLYAPVLGEYDLGSYNVYKDEVAFLLYKGILVPEELDSYLNGASASLMRYEAAVLLTKLMGAEEEVKTRTSVVLDYADTPEIPTRARAYVEYVSQNGLMKGLEDNNFGPNDAVTRVQMTLILSRVLKALDYTTVLGTNGRVDNTEAGAGIVFTAANGATERHAVAADVPVRKDGRPASLSDIASDSEILLLYSQDKLVGIEVLGKDEPASVGGGDKTDSNDSAVSENKPSLKDGKYSGVLSDVMFVNTGVSFKLVSGSKSDEFTVSAADKAKVTIDGRAADLDELVDGYNAAVTVEKGVVTELSAESGTVKVTGAVRSVSEDDMRISVRTDGGSFTYDVDGKVRVTRNSASSDFSRVAEGDSVTLTVTNSVVTAIAATSGETSVSGTLSSIVISSDTKLGIKTDGREDLYSIKENAKITLGGKTVTVYDLRIGTEVTAALDDGVITSVSAVVSPSTYQKTGVITAVNTNNNYITLDISGKTERVYVKKRSNGTISGAIINSASGGAVSFTSLEKGSTVTAIGAYDDDDKFVATTIVVIAE